MHFDKIFSQYQAVWSQVYLGVSPAATHSFSPDAVGACRYLRENPEVTLTIDNGEGSSESEWLKIQENSLSSCSPQQGIERLAWLLQNAAKASFNRAQFQKGAEQKIAELFFHEMDEGGTVFSSFDDTNWKQWRKVTDNDYGDLLIGYIDISIIRFVLWVDVH